MVKYSRQPANETKCKKLFHNLVSVCHAVELTEIEGIAIILWFYW